MKKILIHYVLRCLDSEIQGSNFGKKVLFSHISKTALGNNIVFGSEIPYNLDSRRINYLEDGGDLGEILYI